MESLIDYCKDLNPKEGKSDLVHGAEYRLFRDGKFVGVATWIRCELMGDSFQTKNEKGHHIIHIAERWDRIVKN